MPAQTVNPVLPTQEEMNFYKIGMYFMNLMCIVLSMVTILAGYAVMMRLDRVKTIIGEEPLNFPPMVLYTVGMAMFILVVTVGCVGVKTENATLMFLYSFFMLILTILQVGLACFAVLQVDVVGNSVTSRFKTNFKGVYANDTKSIAYFNEVQTILHCCGFNGHRDYVFAFPESCCGGSDSCTLDNLYKVGCVKAMLDYLHGITEIFSGICILSAMFQFFLVIYIGFFADKVKLTNEYFVY